MRPDTKYKIAETVCGVLLAPVVITVILVALILLRRGCDQQAYSPSRRLPERAQSIRSMLQVPQAAGLERNHDGRSWNLVRSDRHLPGSGCTRACSAQQDEVR